MRIFLLVSIFSLFQLVLFSQISVNKSEYDFGNIEVFYNDTAFFEITNTTNKKAFILPTRPNDDYAILISSQTIEAGETIRIGIVYYTEQKGRFNVAAPLYFSNMVNPVNFFVKGNIKSFHPYALVKCPSIENSKPLPQRIVPLVVVIKDAQTQKIIEQSSLQAKINTINIPCSKTFYTNKHSCKCDYGNIGFVAEAEGYQPKESLFFYDKEHFYHEIFLEKKEVVLSEKEIVVENEIVKEETKPDVVYVPIEKIKDSIVVKSKDSIKPLLPKYKPNHLIFVIDISGSMKDSTKLNYLKISMMEMVKILRPEDYFTLITYAGRSKVVFENINGLNKTQIFEAIDSLNAKGGSYGSEGLITAYEKAHSYYIKNANNQVFLATDGLFNGGSITNEQLFKIAKKEYNKFEIKLTTIGFGKDEKALAFMRKLAENGGGNFILIKYIPQDIEVLEMEVKAQSIVR